MKNRQTYQTEERKLSAKSLELRKKIEESKFEFDATGTKFVPNYGPFAWNAEEIRQCNMFVSGSTTTGHAG